MGRSSNKLAETRSTPFLEQVVGGEKGRIFELAVDRMQLGRNDDNDIVIVSNAVSRHHAYIERISENGYRVLDNGSKNGVQVNGTTVQESELKDGDIVQIGDFAFRFNSPSLVEMESAAPETPEEVPMETFLAPQTAKPNKRILLYGTLGIVFVAVYFMSRSPSSNTSKEDAESSQNESGALEPNKSERYAVRTPPPVLDKSIAISKIPALEDPIMSKAEQEIEKLDWSNPGLKEREQYFRRGQREYLTKNFHRAIEAFQTTLSFDRGHKLALYYLQLTMFEAESEAKKNMEIGIRYFESLQYTRAIYHFQQVATLMSHRPADPMSSDAEKYISLSQRKMQAAELFP